MRLFVIMAKAYIALGSNLGDRLSHLSDAIEAIASLPEETSVMGVSSIYETKPVGYLDQPNFLNAVLVISTDLKADRLLTHLLAIEQQQKRVRSIRNGPRTIDLDLLLYDQQIIEQPPSLIVPHPRMQDRAFVLRPLCDVAANVIHPVFTKTIQALYEVVSGKEDVICYRKTLRRDYEGFVN